MIRDIGLKKSIRNVAKDFDISYKILIRYYKKGHKESNVSTNIEIIGYKIYRVHRRRGTEIDRVLAENGRYLLIVNF